MAQTMIAMLGAGKTITDNQHRELIKLLKEMKRVEKKRKKENHTADDETSLMLPFFLFSSFFRCPLAPSNVGEGLTGKRLHASTPAMCINSL